MEGEWTEVSFADGPIEIHDGDRGKNYPNRKEFKSVGFCVFLNTGNVTQRGFDFVSTDFVSQERDELLRKGKLKRFDTILTTRGTVGNAAFFDSTIQYEHIRINSGMVILRPDLLKLDPRFLYLYVRSENFSAQVSALTSGSAQPQLPIRDIKRVQLRLPPLPEQRAIAHILGSLDDKIELNRQMNATLEGMAQALFKSWFVDFDPVIDNALAAGNPIPEELADRAEVRRAALADGTANREAAKPFPAGFQHTEELGWIPEEWGAVSINNAIEVNPRVSLPKGTVAPYADMKALPTSGYAIGEVASKAYVGGTKFQNHDVLLARITPCLENGKTGIVDFLANDSDVGFGSTEFIVLRQKDEITFPYIACLARDEKFRLHCMQSMVGSSGRQRVQNACFDSFYVAIPTDSSVLGTFIRTTQPMFEKSSEGGFVSRNLTKLRDTLLPKLISGELRIPDAEKLAEEALA